MGDMSRRQTLKTRALTFILSGLLAGSVVAAPVIVTPGSTAGYLYLPASGTGDINVTIDGEGVGGGGGGTPSPSTGSTSCSIEIFGGYTKFTAASDARVYYTLIGGGGAIGAGGSSAILVNGSPVFDASSGLWSVACGGDGAYGSMANATRGQNVNGKLEFEEGDEVTIYVGGGGGGGYIIHGGGGGAGYYGGGGGAGGGSDAIAPARGGCNSGGAGGAHSDASYHGFSGTFETGGNGRYRSVIHNNGGKGRVGGSPANGGGGGGFGGGGGGNGKAGGSNGASSQIPQAGWSEGIGSRERSRGDPGSIEPTNTGYMSGGHAGAALLTYKSDACWIPEW